MSFNKDWQPRPYDIEWTRKLIERLNDGGTWGIPRNKSFWRLDKTNKVFTCVYGPQDDLFQCVTICCQALGYRTDYKLEDMTPVQASERIAGAAAQITEDMFGSGKSVETTTPLNAKTYLHKTIDGVTRRELVANLAKMPVHRRFKRKPGLLCDFCADDHPVEMYAANRLSTGQAVQGWRWLACQSCHHVITQNDFKSLERRIRAASKLDAFAIRMALMAFHTDAIQT